MRPSVRLAFAASVAFVSASAAASPGARSGFGSRSQAVAGAEVADARGAPAVFENPAALVQTPDTELSLGTTFTTYDLTLGGHDPGLASVTTLDFGVVVPGSIATIPVAFGLALSLPNGRLSKLHNADPTSPYYPLDDAGPKLVDLGMALSLRPTAWLAVGGGVGFLATAQGGFSVTGTAVAADGSGSEYESDLRHSVDADLLSVRYPLVGATVTPSKALTLAASFRGSATIEQGVLGRLEGVAVVGATEIPVFYQFETKGALAFLPAVVAFGATARPLPSWRFSAQVDWEGWSSYPSPFASPKTKLEVEPPPGIPITPAEPLPLPAPVVPSDRFVPRVGVEKTFEVGRQLDVVARLGYAYQAAVFPERQSETLLIDFDRHVFALGGGGIFHRPFAPFSELRLDVHASLVAGVERTLTTGPDDAPVPHPVSGRQFGAGATLGLAFDALGGSPRLY
jgi:long-chain fatty acid transport protein